MNDPAAATVRFRQSERRELDRLLDAVGGGSELDEPSVDLGLMIAAYRGRDEPA